ncbi:uncharacterized protein LOC133926262 isoform X3 [Phragmites australis]|uniref:uncharacterized protein LOC133926262 isoform X3 n=1 Tax=Phragmites australis TaxID=29695 RepID=UPI002D797666|nr:uncharacterized protein LOC133926262 isoform X3 [Phragmites australis]
MPRRRPPGPLPPADRDLAEEVLYLHSLWRRGPPAPAPAHAPAHVLVPATAPIPSRSARRKAIKRKRRRLESGAAEPKDAGSEWPLAPSPPASPKAWPDASASASSPAKPPPPSPGSLAQREALRAAEEFFSNLFSDDDEGSESEGDDEAAAAGFFTRLFERDAALRGYYERGWEEGQFACMACSGRKARRGKSRRFRGCVGLVQHARAATRYGRPGVHRALACVICSVLGWDIERLPSIVIDPRGTLGQALAALATASVQEAKNDDTEENNGSSSDEDEEKEDVETGMKGSITDGDKVANELEISKESAEMEDVEEIGPLNCEDHSKNKVIGHETVQEEDAVKTGMEDSKSTDCEKEANELEGGKESAEKEVMEEIGPLNCEDISNEVHCNETVQVVNGNKDDSLSQDNNGEVHQQEIAKESAEQKNTKDLYLPSSKDSCTNEEHYEEAAVQEELSANESKKECAKTADDTKDIAATRLGNNSSMVPPIAICFVST